MKYLKLNFESRDATPELLQRDVPFGIFSINPGLHRTSYRTPMPIFRYSTIMRPQRDLIIILTALSLMACGEATDTHAGQPVAHRRAAFKKILLAFEPIGIQLRKKQYDSNRLIDQAKLLASLKNDPWSYFDADTNYPPTHAKAKVWSDPDQFRAAQQTFVQAVDRFTVVAEDHDEAHARAAYEAVQDSCRNCHKAFKD